MITKLYQIIKKHYNDTINIGAGDIKSDAGQITYCLIKMD